MIHGRDKACLVSTQMPEW